MPTDTQAAQILRMAERHGQVRSREVTAAGIPRAALVRLVRAGRLKQLARGLYALPAQPISKQHALAEVAARSSRGVFCLLTALHFHGLLRRTPDAMWLAIPNKGRVPVDDGTPLRIVRFSGPALTEGVEHYVIDGVPIRVYSVAKTVADCFKFRNRVGLDLAMDALARCRREKGATDAELWHFARICRVAEAMRPHLPAIA